MLLFTELVSLCVVSKELVTWTLILTSRHMDI
jgi:hypothetical protein